MIGFLRRRLDGTNATDPWGLDADLHEVVAPLLARLPFDVAGRVPDGPVLVLTRRRLRVAIGLLRGTGRPVRVLGIPDVEPVASALRRIGGAVAHPAEAGALLRAGHLVVGKPDAGAIKAAEAAHAAIVEIDHDMRVSERWVTCAPDAVHLLGTRDPHPLRGDGSRRR